MRSSRFHYRAAALLAVSGLLAPAAVALRVAWGESGGVDNPLPVETGTHDVGQRRNAVGPRHSLRPFPTFEPPPGSDPTPYEEPRLPVDPPITTVAPPTTHRPFPTFEPQPNQSDSMPDYEDPRLPVDP